MSDTLRSIAGRIREYVADRRRSPRIAARLDAKIVLLDGANGTHVSVSPRSYSIEGYTRDLSSTGFGIIVPSIRIGGHYLMGEDRVLRITLQADKGALTFDCAPVRYERLEEGDADVGYLIGVSINKVAEESADRWQGWLRSHK
jgi:hypothetical protein